MGAEISDQRANTETRADFATYFDPEGSQQIFAVAHGECRFEG